TEVWCAPDQPAPELERACREGSVMRGVGLAGRVWASARSIVVADVGRDDEARRDPRIDRGGFRALAVIPVVAGDDVGGGLELFSVGPGAADPVLGEVLTSVAGQLGELVRRTTAEQALARAEERLVEADRLASLGALAAGVAHEINNPLAYVLLNI